MWSLSILESDDYGLIVNLTDLALTPAGFGHNNCLTDVIRNSYGVDYKLDLSKSFLHNIGYGSGGERGTFLDANMTYELMIDQKKGEYKHHRDNSSHSYEFVLYRN